MITWSISDFSSPVVDAHLTESHKKCFNVMFSWFGLISWPISDISSASVDAKSFGRVCSLIDI